MKRKINPQKLHSFLFRCVEVVVGFLVLCFAIYLAGFHFNFTASVPKGIYLTVREKKTVQYDREGVYLIKKDKLIGYEKNRLLSVRYLMKNIIAMPGDFVELDKTKKQVKINGEFVQGMKIAEKDVYGKKIIRTMQYPCKIPEGYFFVGSHCVEGYDSRYWGLCPKEAIIGRVKLIYEFKHL